MPAIPLLGDRSAWNARDYPDLHANDINSSASSIHHTLGEGPGIDIPPTSGSVGLGGDSFLLYDDDGSPVAEYATLTLALAASTSGTVVVMPAGDFSESVTIPAGVGVIGTGNQSSIVRGAVTLAGDSSYAANVFIIATGNTAGSVVGIIGPQSGSANLFDVQIDATNNGSGNAFGIEIRNGTIETKDSKLIVTTNGSGSAIGIFEDTGSTGIGYSHNNTVYGISTGGGKGHCFATRGLGDIYVTSGFVIATTSPVGDI